MGQNSIVPSTNGKKTFRYGTTKKTDVEKRTKRTLDERTTKSGRSDARVDYVIAENRKTFETRKFGNTRNGPRTRPPSDPVSFRRNLGVFRKRSDPCRFPPLTRHALPSRVVPPERYRGSCPSISDRCLYETAGSPLTPARTVRPRPNAGLGHDPWGFHGVPGDDAVSTNNGRAFRRESNGIPPAGRDHWPDSSSPK